MIRGFDTLQKSINILQKKQENISANVANTNTFGFKAQQIIQRTQEEYDLHNYTGGPELNQRAELGQITFGTEIDEVAQNLAQGSLKATNLPTDFAVQGDGFFTIALANGQRGYTRNGNFKLNENAQLVTQTGDLVLSRGGQPITAANLGQPNFQLTRFPAGAELTRQGDTLFTSNQAGQVDFTSQAQQFHLEGSNVEMADEMVNLLTTAREFETNQKVLSATNETLRRATNELGKV